MPASELKNTTAFAQSPPSSTTPTPGFPLRRILIFISVFLSVLLAANWFVIATLNHFQLSTGAAGKIIPLALTLTFVITTFLGRRFPHPGLRFAYRISAVWLGVLNFSFFAACATWLVSAAAPLLHLPLEPKIIAELFFGIALLVCVYGIANANRLNVTRITVNLPHLPAAWRGRTAALVTDLHLGSVRGARFAHRVVTRLKSLQPAALLISGDLFDGPEPHPDELVAPWKQFSAPSGIYFVTGNHEEFGDRTKLVDAVRRTGIRVLQNEKVDLAGLQIVGVHDDEAGDPPQLRAVLNQAGLDPARPSILLAHQPHGLSIAEEAGISLQLSGHTHGGQLWPWTWVAARVHGRFNYGLNRLGKLQVYTSSGSGTWGIPMRVATKSEIVLIQFA